MDPGTPPVPDPKASPEGRSTPPALATRLLERRLPDEIVEALVGDLHTEYVSKVLPTRGRFLADLWYWGQVASIRSGALRRGARRLAAMRPTPERVRPGHSSAHRSGPWRDLLMHPSDIRYAIRRLVRAPGFTAVAVLSLALGIGANTAMFSIVNAVLIRDVPLTAPEELVEVYTSDSDGFQYATSSFPDYMDLRDENDVFKDVVGTRTTIARLDIGGTPRVVFAELVSWDYFTALGVPMTLGRSFAEEEGRTPGSHPVVVLGHRTWSQDFSADPDILGQSIHVNGRAYTVVGVAPRDFTGSMPVIVTGLYAPLMMTDVIMGSAQLDRRGSRSMFLRGRLLAGVSLEQANAALEVLSTSLEERYPESNENRQLSALAAAAVAIHPAVDGILTPVAALLLGVVGVVLLIACANLASFLLARAEDRRKEVAIRLALGAGRGRLVTQLLVETVLLATLGGLAGLVLANWTVGLLMALRPPLPVPLDLDISLDRTVLGFTAGVSLLAGISFGLVPALQATNPDVAPTLKNEGVGSAPGRRISLRSGLVVTQVAFSFVLLIGAGLFLRSLQKAQLIDTGFDTGPGALAWPLPELSGYETPAAVQAFYMELVAQLRSDPMITGVALADRLPLGAALQSSGYILPGVPSESQDGDHDIDNAHVSDGYFEALGVDILAGEAFTAAHTTGDPVAIVSEAFRDRFYPGEDLIGRSVQRSSGTDLRIVGVAADTKVRTLGESPRPYVYELHGQATFFGVQVLVRGTGTSEELVAATRAAFDAVDPDMVLFEELKTMEEHLSLLLFPPRMAALLLSVFGGLALILAGIGIYGVVSYSVSKRTRELGIRMSLGASGRDVVSMAIRGGMRLVLVGGVVGVLLAAAVTWSVSGYLFGISPTDVATFAVIPMLLSTVALFAAWVPARRASRVDPVRALRME